MAENRAWETEFACGHQIIDRRPKGPESECPFCADPEPFKISRALIYRDDRSAEPVRGEDPNGHKLGCPLYLWSYEVGSGVEIPMCTCGAALTREPPSSSGTPTVCRESVTPSRCPDGGGEPALQYALRCGRCGSLVVGGYRRSRNRLHQSDLHCLGCVNGGGCERAPW
jgi:hypothetical protein